MQDLDELYQSVVERKENPKPGSYTDYLFTNKAFLLTKSKKNSEAESV